MPITLSINKHTDRAKMAGKRHIIEGPLLADSSPSTGRSQTTSTSLNQTFHPHDFFAHDHPLFRGSHMNLSVKP